MKRQSNSAGNEHPVPEQRARALIILLILLFLGILIRLFYWQIVRGAELAEQAEQQYQRNRTLDGERGSIFLADGQPLVTNSVVFRLIAQPHLLAQSPETITTQLMPFLAEDRYAAEVDPESKESHLDAIKEDIRTKLSRTDRKWIPLIQKVSPETQHALAQLDLDGITFEPYQIRTYPEASMAAHVTGFVGKNDTGADVGYFGIEGALEEELQARVRKTQVTTDAFGRQLSAEQVLSHQANQGRDVTLTIRRDIQYMVEEKLAEAMTKYQAKSGEVIVIDPKTGAILALAISPAFDQSKYTQYPQEVFSNPAISHTYEPGSTFKTLTVAAGIDAGEIEPETICTRCSAARRFGQYTIKTWNDVYTPNITMKEALAKSDNTAMIFIAEQLGREKFEEYVRRFGIGERLAIELEGDHDTPFPEKWGEVEVATRSFGQGISLTSMQLVRAVGTIANGGVMMQPRIVQSVSDPITGETIVNEPRELRRVLSENASHITTDMMIYAAQAGEAQWVQSPTHTVAGKTGTSQIATEGGYDPDKTIASYIGFAPPHDPKFLLLVKFTEPQSSIWAAETAAPTWYSIARELFLALNIPPDRAGN